MPRPKKSTSEELASTVSTTSAVAGSSVVDVPVTPSIPAESTQTKPEDSSAKIVEKNDTPEKIVPVAPLRPAAGYVPRPTPVRPTMTRPSMMRPSANSTQPATQVPTSARMPVERVPAHPVTEPIEGMLDTSRDGHGVVRKTYSGTEQDAYISTAIIRRYRLRPGDYIVGHARPPKENDRYWAMAGIDTVNGLPLEEAATADRVKFQSLTPVYPDTQIKLETGEEPLSLRIIDLIAPIGRGQRSLIVSPPKAGKTTLLKEIATGIAKNYSDIHLMAVLVGERPEEVTDIRRHIEKLTAGKGETAASNFDEAPEDQCRVAELALERAKRMVEMGKDVVILLDSITRLARAYNLSIPTSGRTLSGGFDPAAIHPTKRFFGAARNFEVSGSLTIVGTALVDTGSRMDDVVFEEFKGTGNQEIILDRFLAERRIFPSIDVQRSGTRRDDLLIDPMTYQSLITLQRMLDMLDKDQRTITMLEQLKRTKSNKEFLASLKSG